MTRKKTDRNVTDMLICGTYSEDRKEANAHVGEVCWWQGTVERRWKHLLHKKQLFALQGAGTMARNKLHGPLRRDNIHRDARCESVSTRRRA